ncbi:hypothetical protein PSYAE_13687 [Pseudomonas amygdali pv. aesculi str. 0893_23]|nr:hypothetical protein PSYAE_13687 [Pseudomonas amygdali pv. aesculi str. 0893_23]
MPGQHIQRAADHRDRRTKLMTGLIEKGAFPGHELLDPFQMCVYTAGNVFEFFLVVLHWQALRTVFRIELLHA